MQQCYLTPASCSVKTSTDQHDYLDFSRPRVVYTAWKFCPAKLEFKAIPGKIELSFFNLSEVSSLSNSVIY